MDNTPLHPAPPPPLQRRAALPQKNFEKVVAAVLPHVKVSYVPLPPIPSSYSTTNTATDNNDDNNDWPFGGLPPSARVFGTLEGQLSHHPRAKRKEDQLRCMLRCIFALLPSSSSSSSSSASHRRRQQQQPNNDDLEQDEDGVRQRQRPFTIVDFGGGSGHLAIPLALLLQRRHREEEDSFQATTTSTIARRRRPISYRVIVVDLGKRSLDLLHKKASHCGANDDGSVKHVVVVHHDEDVDARLRPCHGIPNLFTFHGPVEDFNDIPFDMGIALHLCGEATDVALRKCLINNGHQQSLPSLVFCPCCVGKLNAQRKNPYIWQATGTNMPTISYPQSKIFQQYISSKEDWNALAQAADYSSHCSSSTIKNDTSSDTITTTTPSHESRTHSNAIRRTAKALVETDRLLFLQEQTTTTYETALTRMIPWESTPKNDIIMAWPIKATNVNGGGGTSHDDHDYDDCRSNSELNATISSACLTTTIARQPWMDASDLECEADIHRTRNLLVASNRAKNDSADSSSPAAAAAENHHSYATPSDATGVVVVQDSIYWTAQEEMEIRNQLQDYFFNNYNDIDDDGHHHAISSNIKADDKNEQTQPRKILIFPTGMGRRKRKLVHHVAELLNLAHWCEGRKAGDKTVAVALRRIQPPSLLSSAAATTSCKSSNNSNNDNLAG